MHCTYCGSATHAAALCPRTRTGSSARRNLWCSYCGKKDHEYQACPKTYNGNAARAWYPDKVADHFIKD